MKVNTGYRDTLLRSVCSGYVSNFNAVVIKHIENWTEKSMGEKQCCHQRRYVGSRGSLGQAHNTQISPYLQYSFVTNVFVLASLLILYKK